MNYRKIVIGMSALAVILVASNSAQAEPGYPSKPIEFVCATAPGSGAAQWCTLMAQELQKPGRFGVPVTVLFKNAGSNHESVVYTYSKPADGYTIKHATGSFAGYYNLPHYTRGPDDFDIVARVEQTLYGVAMRCDNAQGIKSWKDLVSYAKKHPGELAMGSNKVGSLHHQHQTALLQTAGVDVRFIPYKGTGGVVKDVVGGHLAIGFAQPSLWNQHIEAGTVCPLLMLNEERIIDPRWKDVPSVRDAGLNYDIPKQWQGFEVRKGTPPAIMDTIAAAVQAVTESEAYKMYLSTRPEVVPAFEDDREKLKTSVAKDVKNARQFMIESGIIKADGKG